MMFYYFWFVYKCFMGRRKKFLEDVATLEGRREHLELRRQQIETAMADLRNERSALAQELNEIRQALESQKLKVEKPTVSQHALMRYASRVLGVDFEEIEKRMLSPVNCAAIEAGATALKLDGLKLVIRDKVIVTIVD